MSSPIPIEDTIAQECLAVRLRIVHRVATRIYDDALRPTGMTISQLNILVATALLKRVRPAEVCERLQMDASTLSRNVERMKAHGWLETVPDEDRRAQPLRITPKGRRLLARAKPAWDAAQAQVQGLLGAETFAALDSAVRRIHRSEI